MKNNVALIFAAILISASMIFTALYIGNAISSTNDKTQVGRGENDTSLLMNADQAAEYIGISTDTLISKIKKEKIEKHSLNVYDTYRFIPYLEIDGVIYFTKDELQKWAEYQTQNH